MKELPPERRRWVQESMASVDSELRRLAVAAEQHEELRSVAHEAIVRCVRQFNPELGVPFAAYCRQRMRWAMVDHLRKENRSFRKSLRNDRDVERLESLRQLPACALAPETWQDAQRVEQERSKLLEFDTQLHLLASAGSSAQERHNQHLLNHLLRASPPGDRSVLTALYREGISVNQYARRHGICRSTASRRHARALLRLRRHAQKLLGPDLSASSATKPRDPKGRSGSS